MKPVAKDEVREMMSTMEDLVVINLLDCEQFEGKVIKAVPNKFTPIVVYCARFECQASPKVARRLEVIGYEEVYDYKGGIKDWKEAGYPLKGTQA